jgi:hypothetical protein
LQMPSKCCPNSLVPVRRYVATQRVADPSAGSVYFSQKTSGPNVTAYKALSYAHGTRFKYEVKRVGLIGSSGRIGQLAQAVGSYVLPGDISPLRSPVRSAVYSAITPGLPGGRGLRRPGKRNRTSRCPEGYQYGGRFTDNQFSTCGQKLFDIPGPLGAAISAITRAVRRLEQATISDVKPNPIGPGEYGDPVIQARRPEIPRVGNANVKQRLAEVERLAREMGAPNISATRMVRRDGYVLEPVVSPKVLRAIPDNRDMENATYLLRINNVPSIGQDELGLLSNTGITNVTWVLPGGSTLSVEKVRALTVGERRKLGRTVNAVAKLDNSENPSARLQKLVEETGDGLKYSENFIDIKRPHELIASRNGKQTERWVNELFKKKPEKETSSNRESSSISSIKDRITSLSEAIDHIAAGGSLSEVSPEVLQKALSQVGLFKRRNLGNGVEMFEGPNKKSYLSMRPRSDFAHLDDSFASDFQQHLGLESPDVYRLGKGKRAPYLVESTSNVFPGYEKNKDVTLPEASPQKMAALLVSDFVNGTKNRNPGTVDVYKRDKANDIAVSDLGSELTELSKISIVARQKNAVEDMDSLAEEGTFGRYFRELQKEQQRIFIRELKKLLDKARSFNFVNYKERLVRDGILTDQERNHLEIVKTITEQRLNTLEKQQDVLLAILGGRK